VTRWVREQLRQARQRDAGTARRLARFSGSAAPSGGLSDGGSGAGDGGEEEEEGEEELAYGEEEEEEEEEREEDADALEASREAALCTPLLARAKFLLNEVRVAREAYI